MSHCLRLFLLFSLLCVALPSAAQQMAIDNFARMKRGLLRGKTFETDKTQATLDLYTSEKGFTFVADGGKDATATEDDDHITLLVPHRTRSLTIRHPDYGELTWKVPSDVKTLRKKRRYRCDLLTMSTKKEFRQIKQWLVMSTDPAHAILHIDSTQLQINGGKAQLYLPLGEHSYMVEAPFHAPVEGTVTLSDTGRTDRHVVLPPLYCYLSVKTPLEGATILLNGAPIGQTKAVTNRLASGRYRLTVVRNGVCFYNEWVHLRPAEKKVVELTEQQLYAVAIPKDMTLAQLSELPTGHDATATMRIEAPVHLIAPDDETTILLNRDSVGVGEWQGTLEGGYYAVNTVKDGLESATVPLWIESDREQTLNLSAPQSAYGMLNVVANVVDAHLTIDGKPKGTTPTVVRNLPAGRSYRVTVEKEGYKDATETVYIRGNEMSRVSIKLKKK